MFETLDRLFLAGIGAMSMTKERAERIFDEYVAKGRSAKETSKSGFVKELMASAEKTRSEMEHLVSKQVREVLQTLEVATRDDVARLEGKIDQLLSREGQEA